MQTYGEVVDSNGTRFNGYLGLIQSGVVDTFAANFIPLTERLQEFEFS